MKCKFSFAVLLGAATSLAQAATLDEVVVTATRFEGNSTATPVNLTVITAEDIRQSSARTLPELLSTQAGISTRDLFGSNAAAASVDMRGFGAASGQNTLILLDGRRITDPDLSGVQWSAIPFAAIERIEIVRGSGAVLYGDGASSGVINIITRSSLNPGSTGTLSVRAGSYGTGEAQASAGYFSGSAGIDASASKYSSQGYRNNNRNDQANAQANLRWLTAAGELNLKMGLDKQDIRLPGGRTVQPAIGVDLVSTDPRGTATPLDYASRDGNQLALEWRQNLAGTDVNIGLARRGKNQRSYFDFGGFPEYRDGDLTVYSFTPRVRIPHEIGGQSSLVAGIDIHRWDYAQRTSNSPVNIDQPINHIALSQRNDAWYLQNTARLSGAMTLLMGFRNERISMNGTDVYDGSAPGAFFGSAAPAGSFSVSRSAYDLGLRHQLESGLSINGKIGRSFRFANVDEIYEFSPTFSREFQFLRPQTVNGRELWLDQQSHSGSWRAAVFSNKVYDEIHLDPFGTGVGNTNLPPSCRQGVELDGKWQALSNVMLNAAFTYTDARFLSGAWESKHVPLVASRKAHMGVSWAVSEQTRLNGTLSHVGSQFMENDEPNTLGMDIPAYSTADIKLVHQIGEFQLNASVNNLFDRNYFNYAVSSQFTAGKYSAYPLPGRTFYLGLSYRQ